MQGHQYGANWSWCGHCHHKLRFQIQSTRFHQLQSSALDTSGWLTIFAFCPNKTIRSPVLNVSHYMPNFLCQVNPVHYKPFQKKNWFQVNVFSRTFRYHIVPEHWQHISFSVPECPIYSCLP